MIPAKAMGRSASAMTSMSCFQFPFGFIQERNLFPGLGLADFDLGTVNLSQVEGVQGLAHFEKNEVGHVHDVVDGFLPELF